MFDQFITNTQKIWIYQFKEHISEQEMSTLNNAMKAFTADWQSHGNTLQANFKLFDKKILVVTVDEQSFEASGCSIDKLTHKLAALNETLNINLFNRMDIAIAIDHQITLLSKAQVLAALKIGVLKENDLFVDLSITKGTDASKILKPLNKGWFFKIATDA